jgi:hypothetical protein
LGLNRATGTELWSVPGALAQPGVLSVLGSTVLTAYEALAATTGAQTDDRSHFNTYWLGAAPPFAYASAFRDRTLFWWNGSGIQADRDQTAPYLYINNVSDGFETGDPRPTIAFDAYDSPYGTPNVGITKFEVRVDGVAQPDLPGTATQFQPASDLADGPHSIQIKAFDELGNATAETVNFTVDTRPVPVVQLPSYEGSWVMTGTPVEFSAYAYYEEGFGNSITRYEWDLDGNGTFETDTQGVETVSKTYDQAGVINVGVRVTGTTGRSATDTTPLDVRLTPPEGEIGVSINDGDVATNDPNVTLSLVWPPGANTVVISNDGGFGAAGGTQTFPVAARIPWQLISSGPERLPKVVYVRFKGVDANTDANPYQDDIILDERPPKVAKAAVAGGGDKSAAKRTFRIAVRATDDNSGVAVAEFLNSKKGKPVERIRFVPPNQKGKRKLKKVVEITAAKLPKYVRVVDSGHNESRAERVSDKRRNI